MDHVFEMDSVGEDVGQGMQRVKWLLLLEVERILRYILNYSGVVLVGHPGIEFIQHELASRPRELLFLFHGILQFAH